MLLYSAGRDVTELFQAYHSTTAEKILEKYKIGVLATSEFPVLRQSSFYDTVKQRVERHLRSKQADVRKSPLIYFIFAFVPLVALLLHLLAVTSAAYSVRAMFFTRHSIGSLITCQTCLIKSLAIPFALLEGLALASSAMHLAHECSHAAATHSPTLWRSGVCILD